MEAFAELLGRLHPLIVHLPIGILLLGVFLYFFSRRTPALQPAVPVTLFWGAVTAVFACVAGYFLKLSGGYEEQALALHQNTGIATAVLAVLAWLAVRNGENIAWIGRLRTGIISLTALFLFVAGHFGGNLTHGEDFLSQPVMALLGKEVPAQQAAAPKITDINKAVVYADLVEPIFKQKCWQCHNAKKIKGELRMDEIELFLKGGKHGKVLVPGHADQSELVKRLLLPEEDDHHMPPKGKTQLTDEEVALVQWWIANGKADFKAVVASVPTDEKIKPFLAKYGGGSSAADSGPDLEQQVLAGKVSAGDASLIKKLTAQNVLVLPVANESNFLAVNTVNAAEFSDAQADWLTGLSDQIVWLKLGDTKVSDQALRSVARLKNLTRLSLEHTTVSDAGVGSLKDLHQLQNLNLVGTKVSDQSVEALGQLKQLRTLYLWQTQFTPAGVEKLRKLLPHTQVDFGGYDLPKLTSDTLIYKDKPKTT
jgi:uncharacterized membrane protein/mono/diheme cytochrome c family protein